MRYSIRDGFKFCAIVYPFNVENAIIIDPSLHPMEKYINYINKNGIEQVKFISQNFSILKDCPMVKYVDVKFDISFEGEIDFSELYCKDDIISLNCLNVYGNLLGWQKEHISTIDYSRFPNLENLFFIHNKGSLNFNTLKNLKSLLVSEYKNKDLTDLFCSENIDTIELIACKNKSLEGIDKTKRLQCLYLLSCRSLNDISQLKEVKSTLKTLVIDGCPKVTDFSVLSELTSLEHLMLLGSNSIDNLNFIKSLKNLKTLNFDINVVDGDLTLCENLSYVYSARNRKHYNLKDSSLPKNKYVMGNEDIEEWRHLY